MDRLGRADRPAATASIDAYRCEDADEILVAMGTIADTARAVVDDLRDEGARVGAVARHRVPAVPGRRSSPRRSRRAQRVAVVERTDEPAAADNPLTREMKAALYAARRRRRRGPARASPSRPASARRDVDAGDLAAVFDWLD